MNYIFIRSLYVFKRLALEIELFDCKIIICGVSRIDEQSMFE